MINNIFIIFLNMGISASIVAVLLILWRQLTKRYIPAKFYYILWGTILFRLIIPFSFKSPFSLLNVVSNSDRYIQGNHYVVTMEYIDFADVYGKAVVNDFDILNLLSALWIIGAVIMVALWVVFFSRTSRKLQYAVICKDNVINDVKKDFGIKKDIKIFKTHYVVSPMVLGLLNPRIIFSDKSHTDENDFRFALAHEMVHIKRKDHLIKMAAYFALALHWYNPIIWLCFYMLNEDIEKSCDEAVVGQYGTECKKHYATALINYADYTGRFQFGYISFAKEKVSRRVVNILNYEKLPFAKIVVFALVTVTIGITVTANPVLAAEYTYIPKTVYLQSNQRQAFKTLAQEFSDDVSQKDVLAITKKATADAEYFADLYKVFEQDDIQLQVENIFYTSKNTADVHYKMTNSKNIVFPQGTQQIVAQIAHSNIMGGLYVESLHTYDDYNSFSFVDKQNEAVQIVDKMIKFGLTSGENTPQNADKIAAFCMDMAFDRAKNENLVLIPAQQVENIADEFFLIKDYTNLHSTDCFDKTADAYVYDKNAGTSYEYRIMNLEKYDDGASVTVYFYKDPLQTQIEKIVKYNLKKE